MNDSTQRRKGAKAQLYFTNTEANQSVALPALDETGEPPKGLGRDGHKPLMRNRKANELPSPIGNAAGNIFKPSRLCDLASLR